MKSILTNFKQATIEEIGSYVYALIDPRKPSRAKPLEDPRRIFYVGKGSGQRCFKHAEAAVKWKRGDDPNPKISLIRQIRRETGEPPPIQIVVHNLEPDEAYRLESALIKILRTDGNLADGKHTKDFCLPVDEIEGRYSHPLFESEIGHRVLLVSLNGIEAAGLPPFPLIKERSLPRRVLKWWRVAKERADEVQYIIGVYKQLTRCVFKVDQHPDGRSIHHREKMGLKKNRRPNWKRVFRGKRCLEKELIWGNREIKNSAGKVLTKFAWQAGPQLIGKHSK